MVRETVLLAAISVLTRSSCGRSHPAEPNGQPAGATWTPKVGQRRAIWAILGGSGPLLYILLGSR